VATMAGTERRTIPLWAKALLFAVSYVLAAEIGNALSVQNAFSTFWPPAGLFVAMLLITERKDWPVLIVAGVAGNLCSDLLHGRALLMTLGFSAANALEALTGATLIRALIGHRPRLDTLRQVLAFVAFGALLAPIVGATAGTAVVMFGAPGAVWWSTWATWWIGDVLGIVLVGSLILSAVGLWDAYRDDPAPQVRRYVQPALTALAIAVPFSVLAAFVFAPAGGTSWKFTTTPGYLAAAIVGGPFGAALGLVCIATAGVAGMVAGVPHDSLATTSIATNVLQAQMFFVFGGVATLALAGVIAENRRNAANAEAAASQFRGLFNTMSEGVAYCRMLFDEDGQPADWIYLQVNDAFGRLTGLDDVVGRHVWEVLPDLEVSNPEIYEVYGRVASTGVPALLESLVVPIGRTLRISVTSPASGEFLAVFEDVTDRVTHERELAESNKRLEKMVYDVAEAMGSVVEARDPYTQGHELRVASLGKRIALEMGMAEDAINEINMAGLLHDIGKLRIPAEILTKPGKLSTTEFALIKEHPEQGFEILGHIDFPWPIAEIVREHHERLDGSGYPRGLVADEIMLPARILAVADVVEAMASHRPYRPAVGLDQAIAEISTHSELYDSAAVAACVRLYERGETGL
jgi:putative nucleotidyltransferase with HDIG domain